MDGYTIFGLLAITQTILWMTLTPTLNNSIVSNEKGDAMKIIIVVNAITNETIKIVLNVLLLFSDFNPTVANTLMLLYITIYYKI